MDIVVLSRHSGAGSRHSGQSSVQASSEEWPEKW